MDKTVRRRPLIFAGLDPSAGSSKASGICLLGENRQILHLGKWYTFRELIDILFNYKHQIVGVGIDGPLQPPHELKKCCFQSETYCDHQQTTNYKGRYCEYLLNKNGYRCFTTSKNSFAKKWAYRCFELNDYVINHGFSTKEVYPTAARKILFPGLNGAKQLKSARKTLQNKLNDWGVLFAQSEIIHTSDELDAVLAAVTIWLDHNQKTTPVGDREDGYIVLPEIKFKHYS